MLILSILHKIFLTPDEARKLHGGEEIEVVGISIPVWSFDGNTSEPAEEIFCKYKLTNKKQESIKVEADGYRINVTQLPEDYVESDLKDKLTNETWMKMSSAERQEWYDKNKEPLSSKMILPLNEGGSEHLHFKEFNKIKKKDKVTTLIHIVEIELMKNLTDTLS